MKFMMLIGAVISRPLLLVLVLLLAVIGSKALKDVIVNIPSAAKIMDTVTLQCKYDLEGDPLYTVKWYKGQKEFYRYIPKELPNTQVFPLPAMDIDISKSNPTEVVLRNLQSEMTGRYKCEVSSDAPNFYTRTMSGYMYVIDVPVEDPEMKIEKDVLEIGYSIKGNCTSPPSYPPVNITWYLNGKKINESYMKTITDPNGIIQKNTRRQPVVTISGLDLEIDSNTFQGGKARLQCIATLFNLYKKEKEAVFEEERPRPRPSSVLGTRDSASDSSTLNRAATQLVVVTAFVVGLVCTR